jgi:hypothetical protein
MIVRDLYPLSPPQAWQDFEDLCHLYCKARWRDPSVQKNGRQGQAQAGVDVFGADRNGLAWGVQCKGKTDYPGGRLTEKTIRTEAANAEAFQPSLDRYASAAAILRDAEAQQTARLITLANKKRKRFTVEIWSWEDIRDDLYDYPEVIRRFYPDYFSTSGLDRLVRLAGGVCRIDLYGADSLERIARAIDQLDGEAPKRTLATTARAHLGL